MNKNLSLLAAAAFAGMAAVAPTAPAAANDLAIKIAPSADNPTSPQMGDNLSFETRITNTGTSPVEGVIAWLSIVRVDKDKEAPIGLEDWSAEKAVTQSSLAPGKTILTDWPMRLIQAGHYRVVVSAASREGHDLASSPFANFAVREKPVVKSRRVLPVALGMPVLLLLVFSYRRRLPYIPN
jgi:hypothetical protein